MRRTVSRPAGVPLEGQRPARGRELPPSAHRVVRPGAHGPGRGRAGDTAAEFVVGVGNGAAVHGLGLEASVAVTEVGDRGVRADGLGELPREAQFTARHGWALCRVPRGPVDAFTFFAVQRAPPTTRRRFARASTEPPRTPDHQFRSDPTALEIISSDVHTGLSYMAVTRIRPLWNAMAQATRGVRRWPGPTHPSGMPGAQVHPLTPQPRPPAAPPASNPVGTPLGLVAQDELVALVGDVAAAGFVVSGPLKGLAAEEGVAADGLRGSHTKGSSATGVGPEHPGRSGRVGPAQHLCLNAYHLRRPGEKHDHQGHRARTSEFRP